MGMDFNMILGHKLTISEIASLSDPNELWETLNKYLESELNYYPPNNYIRWTQEPTEENLSEFWNKIEVDGYYDKTLELDCYFGNITVYRNTIRIWFSTIFYSYKFFQDVKSTIQIINVGRIFATYLRTNKVLYIPDGYLKTAIIENYACSDLTLNEAIEKGIKEFGQPPQGISKGRKNYFFVDNLENEIGEIKEWNEEEEYWKWDDKEGVYVQIKK